MRQLTTIRGSNSSHSASCRILWRALRVLGLALACVCAASCGTAPEPPSARQEEARDSRELPRRTGVGYDLARDEQRGGHTLDRHVARTEEQLRERLEHEKNISAASTWNDRETAQEVVAEALAAQRARLENWTRRGYPRANLALHFHAGRVIGRSLRRGDTATVECTRAVIVLRADGPDGFYVLTTYPEASE